MKVTAISQLRKKRWYEKDGEYRLFLFRDVNGIFFFQTEDDIKNKKISGSLDPKWWINSHRVNR